MKVIFAMAAMFLTFRWLSLLCLIECWLYAKLHKGSEFWVEIKQGETKLDLSITVYLNPPPGERIKW